MQLTDEDAIVVAKAYFSPAVLPNLTITKVRQACLIEDVAFSKKLKLNDLLVAFGRSLVNNKRVKLGKCRHLTREDIQLQ
jgi:hypothetical protein